MANQPTVIQVYVSDDLKEFVREQSKFYETSESDYVKRLIIEERFREIGGE